MFSRPKIVAVDGPAGSGKSSICQKVADAVGWNYINTGALYRAAGLIAARSGIDLNNEELVAELIEDIAPDLYWDSARKRVLLKDEDLTPFLNSEEAGYGASKVAKYPSVRTALLPIQRDITLASPVGALVDGRDIGTVVFPDADLKVFLTASLEARSKRRLHQLGTEDPNALQDVMQGLAKRDARDGGRATAPLKQADDAIVLDTSNLNFEETIQSLIRLLRERNLLP